MYNPEKMEGAILNVQSRDTGNINLSQYTERRHTKQKNTKQKVIKMSNIDSPKNRGDPMYSRKL